MLVLECYKIIGSSYSATQSMIFLLGYSFGHELAEFQFRVVKDAHKMDIHYVFEFLVSSHMILSYY